MRARFGNPFCTIAAAVCFVGCAHRGHEAVYSSVPATPTSNSSADRVYTTTVTAPNGAKGSITYGSVGQDESADVADTVRKTVLSDPKLAPYPSKVTAMMDPNSKGRVILTGKVPTGRVKEDLVEHVRQVPGVTSVEDRLALELPTSSRESDPRENQK